MVIELLSVVMKSCERWLMYVFNHVKLWWIKITQIVKGIGLQSCGCNFFQYYWTCHDPTSKSLNIYPKGKLILLMQFQSTALDSRLFTSLQKQASCHLATDLLSTSRYQDVFERLATACWRKVCGKLSTDLLQVDCQNLLSMSSLLQVVSTSCNKSVNDKLQQAWFYSLTSFYRYFGLVINESITNIWVNI